MMPISGYDFIERKLQNHEPMIKGSNAPVSWVARELELGVTIDKILDHFDGRIPKAAFEEVQRYAKENAGEIQGYIAESIKRSGTSFRTHGG